MSDLLIKMPLQYEPLQQNRFLARFPSDLGIQEWWVAKFDSPSISIDSKEIPFLNTETYVAGKYRWEAINIDFRLPIGPSATQALMEWIRLVAESVTGRMGYAIGYKRNIELEWLDPTGVAVSKWILVNAWPKSFKPGSGDYSSSGLLNASVNLVYDYAICAY